MCLQIYNSRSFTVITNINRSDNSPNHTIPFPDICSLPKEEGPCDKYYERWYHNQATGYCEQFVYKGCHGNKNRFESEQECRQQCNAQPPVGESTASVLLISNNICPRHSTKVIQGSLCHNIWCGSI